MRMSISAHGGISSARCPELPPSNADTGASPTRLRAPPGRLSRQLNG